MIRPSDVPIEDGGFLTDYLGNFEAEVTAALLVRYHQAKGLPEWVPVTCRQLAEFLKGDELVRGWARNPLWRPLAIHLVALEYVDGWEDSDAPGVVTPKLLEHLAERGAWKRDREGGGRS